MRAAAMAASQPAWPAPTTTTSYFSVNCIATDLPHSCLYSNNRRAGRFAGKATICNNRAGGVPMRNAGVVLLGSILMVGTAVAQAPQERRAQPQTPKAQPQAPDTQAQNNA